MKGKAAMYILNNKLSIVSFENIKENIRPFKKITSGENSRGNTSRIYWIG